MRMPTVVTIAAASAVLFAAGCSSVGSPAMPSVPFAAGQTRMQHARYADATSMLTAMFKRAPKVRTSDPRMSFDSCPSTGMLIYAADFSLSVINIYEQNFTLCGQIAGLTNPQGMTVFRGDLLVANTTANDVWRFHRGATTPWKVYTDPTNGPQFPVDVTVLRDGTVVASNIFSQSAGGSLSTWHRNGTLVGNFVPPDMLESFFVTNTDNTTVYGDGFDNNDVTAFWTMDCAGGACTGMTDLGEAMQAPGGVVDTRSGDILASDQIDNTADTFEMPDLTPATFDWVANGDTDGIDATEHGGIEAVYGADAIHNTVDCYAYKQSGVSPGQCGSISGNSGGEMVAVAVDPGS